MKKRNSQVLNFLSIAGNTVSGSIIQASGVEEENMQTIHLAPLETLQLSVRDTWVKEDSDESIESSNKSISSEKSK